MSTLSGGGFMSGDNQSSPSKGGSYSKRGPNSTLRPVTIRQLTDAHQAHPDAEFVVDGSELSLLTFIGRIVSASPTTSNISYNIHDGTGTIDVRQWSTESENTETIAEGTNVRIVGNIKSFNNKRHISAIHVRPIEDPMEEIYHILEVIYVHNVFTNGGPTSGRKNGDAMDEDAYKPHGSTVSSGIDTSGMNHLQKKIANYINNVSDIPDDGINIEQISKACMPATYQEVENEVQNLISEGQLYTTVDDYHVLSAMQ